MRVIDLNADLGEDPGQIARDVEILEVVSSASIACGGHAGDERTIAAILDAAARLGASIGAHPSYPDRVNFGRVDSNATPADVREFVREQVGLLARLSSARGAALRHVKPHGALYHAAEHAEIALAIADGALASSPAVAFVGLAGSSAITHWRRAGHEAWAEGFADRRLENGRLVSRSLPDALILDPDEAAANAIGLARAGRCDTLCVHSDTPRSAEIARAVRRELERAGFTIAAPGRR